MATTTKTATPTWAVLTTNEALFQKLGNNDVYIAYADSAPTDLNDAHLITHTSIVTLPAPTTGSIYFACRVDTVKTVLTEM